MKIAITGKRRITPEQLAEIKLFIEALAKAVPGAAVVVNERYRPVLAQGVDLAALGWREEDSLKGADLAISIGGDGTLLRTARWIGGHETPILGINSGHLGYLTDITLEEASKWVEKIAALDFDIDARTLLTVEVHGENVPPVPYPFALNEIAILRDEKASIISVNTTLNAQPLASYRADGLIVATPTGSTGYNLSVGGPILSPRTPGFVLSPVAAHSLNMRPLVVSDSAVIDINVETRTGTFCLAIDGRSITLPSTARLRLKRAPFDTRIVVRRDHNFAETLRNKLLWGIDAR
ncbi:MAG: NAD(+)/NADH kinase [Muribaculaceae bacterium]|nr:NAD(+)/NADH kinase [Muribaculaceae bacterium]